MSLFLTQQFNQKFMRQVTYTRPPDFVDPFTQPPPPVEEKPRPKKPQLSFAHVNRVRSMKQSKNSENQSVERRENDDDNNNYGETFEADDDDGDKRLGNEMDGDFDEEENDDEFYSETSDDRIRMDLIAIQRKVRIVEDVEPKEGDSKSNLVYFLDATVQCWMLDKEDVVISVTTIPSPEKPESIEAEAEIDLQDLSAIRGGVAADSESDSAGETASNKSSSLSFIVNYL